MLSAVTDAIQQGAFRRGANMGIMRVDHPDILAFIDLKSDLAQVTNFNLSVAMTDDFMAAVKADPHKLHVVVNPHTGQSGVLAKDTGTADYAGQPDTHADRYYTVRELWHRLVRACLAVRRPGPRLHRRGEPPQSDAALGPDSGHQSLWRTAPLALRGLQPGFHQPRRVPQTSFGRGFRRANRLAIACGKRPNWRFASSTTSWRRTSIPPRRLSEATRATRKIGLGVMGFADLLFELGIAYDCDDAVQLAERIGCFIRDAGWVASERLAESRGSFPSWQGSVWDTQHDGQLMRNAQVTTIAPTGTISIIAGCSSGIEPVFSLAFTRQVLDGKKLVEVNPVFEAALREHFSDQDQIDAIVEHAATHGSIQDLA